MDWTSYHASYYKKNGEIDRKAECDAYWKEGLNRGHFEVVRSAMVGTTYYAAVKAILRRIGDGKDTYEPIPESEQKVFGVVFLTTVDRKDYYNFAYKDMDETCGPCQTDCPLGILKLLDKTDNAYAIAWRNACVESAKKRVQHTNSRKKLKELSVGSSIEFYATSDFSSGVKAGDRVRLTKRFIWNKAIWTDGAYSWKECWIPDEFEVVAS